MAHGKPTLLCECFQSYVAVQVLVEQFHNPPALPWRKAALEILDGFWNLTVPPDKMRTNHHGERIHEQLRKHLRPFQTRQNCLRQVMESRVGGSINAVKTLSSRHSGIIRERI